MQASNRSHSAAETTLRPGEGGTPAPEKKPPKDAFQKSYVHRFLGNIQDDRVDEVLNNLGNCTTLRCVIQGHDRLFGRTRFNLPHFFLVGWPATGAESLLDYLSHHPQFLRGNIDNPHWFTACKPGETTKICRASSEEEYVKEVLRVKEAAALQIEAATVDASNDYAGRGATIARRLYRLFPWAKIVIILREPFTRMVTHIRKAEEDELDSVDGCEPGETSFFCILQRFSTLLNMHIVSRQELGFDV